MATKRMVKVCVRCDECDEHGIQHLGRGKKSVEITCQVCRGSKCVGEPVEVDPTDREALRKHFSESMDPCEQCSGAGTIPAKITRCKACDGIGIKKELQANLTKIFDLQMLANDAELAMAIKASAKCRECSGLGHSKPKQLCPVCRGTARNPQYLVVPGEINQTLVEWMAKKNLWCNSKPERRIKHDAIIGYDIQCPGCRGTGAMQGADSGGGYVSYVCTRCHGKMTVSSGKARISQIIRLYHTLQNANELACPLCKGTGLDETERRCKGCQGARINTSLVILRLPKGKKTLHDFLQQN